MDAVMIAVEQGMLNRVRAEYLEMPGLRVTACQAGRLWGLDSDTSERLLQVLIEQRFLFRTPDGYYARLADGLVALTPSRPMRKGEKRRDSSEWRREGAAV